MSHCPVSARGPGPQLLLVSLSHHLPAFPLATVLHQGSDVQCTLWYDTEIQNLMIFNSKHLAYCMSPAPDKPLDEGFGASRLILGFPDSVEAPA